MKLISFTGLRGRLTCVVVLLLGGLLNVALFSQETDNVKSELFREIDAAMNSARQEEVPILSPNLYAKARELYRRADAEYKKGERLGKIRKRIAEAAAALKKAVAAAEITKVALAEILRIRKESADRESATLAPNEFRKAEGKYKEAILKAEAGDIRSANKKADEAMRAYREMTITALLKGPIKTAEEQLKKGRAKVSRQTYKTAEHDLKTLKKTLKNAKSENFNLAAFATEKRSKIETILSAIYAPESSNRQTVSRARGKAENRHWENLTRQQQREAPDSQLVLVHRGQVATLGEVRAQHKTRLREIAGQVKQADRQIGPGKMIKIQQLQRELRKEKMTRRNAANARVEERLKKLSGDEILANIAKVATLLSPQIIDVIGLVQPGEEILVQGYSLGSAPGTISLWGDFGMLSELALENVDWPQTGAYVKVRVPNITGVKHQRVKVVVKRADGVISPGFEVDFTALTEIRILTYGEAVNVKCGTDGTENSCNDWTDPYDYDPPTHSGAATGSHCNAWAAIGNDYGYDEYDVKLQNGWVSKSVNVYEVSPLQWGEAGFSANNLSPGKSSFKVGISWWVSPNDCLIYRVQIHVEGPVGVPYK